MYPCNSSVSASRWIAAYLVGACVLGNSLASYGQTAHVRHSRFPNTASNDPQLQIPQDQGQYCYTPESARSGYDQFEQFDTFPQPASKGYLCINIPAGERL